MKNLLLSTLAILISTTTAVAANKPSSKLMSIDSQNEYLVEVAKKIRQSNLKEKVQIYNTQEGLKIEFPSEFIPKDITGKVFLYRPSNKQLDFEIPISLTNTYLLVPEKRLLDGRWNITIFWNYKNTAYLFKKELIY